MDLKKLQKIRSDFPILRRKVNGRPLNYLDNAATTQKPQAVLDKIQDFYTRYSSNVERGVHALSVEASENYGFARARVMKFIGAINSQEIIFTRGTTESINLVAASFGGSRVREGDEIIISEMEHHSNLVPWQVLTRQKKAKLRVVPVTDRGELDLAIYAKMLNPKTRLVALAHVSNVLGTINPAKKIVELAHAKNIPVLLDGAQAVAHLKVDVSDLDCDFYVFSGHKIYGPTGIGVLYGKKEWLDQMPPYQTGGGMICAVSLGKTKYRPLPEKFEAGTPNLSGALGLRAALDYLDQIGLMTVSRHEQELLEHANHLLGQIPAVKIIGQAPRKVGVISLVVDKIHPHDLGTLLDQAGIAVRTGHHCAQPLSQRFDVPATLRISLGVYNTSAEVEQFVAELKKAIDFLK